MYSYDRTAAKGASEADFHALKKAVLGGADARELLKLAKKIRRSFYTPLIPDKLKEMQWWTRSPREGFGGTVDPRKQFAAEIDKALKQWKETEGHLQAARNAVPKTKKLMKQLQSTLTLMEELRKDEGADYYHHELDRTKPVIQTLGSLLKVFVERGGA